MTKYILLLSLLLPSPALLYNLYRPENVCPKPEVNHCQCCLKIPIALTAPSFESRLAHPQQFQEAHPLPSYFDVSPEEDQVPKRKRLEDQENINIGYLNLDSLKTSNFAELSSDEFVSVPNKKKPTWETSENGSPKFLPDVLATPEEQHEKPIVEEDGPSPITDAVALERSELTQETRDLGNTELGEINRVPEIVLDTITSATSNSLVSEDEFRKIQGQKNVLEATPTDTEVSTVRTASSKNEVTKKRENKKKIKKNKNKVDKEDKSDVKEKTVEVSSNIGDEKKDAVQIENGDVEKTSGTTIESRIADSSTDKSILEDLLKAM